MKYLKTYERLNKLKNIILDYNIGDYVLLNPVNNDNEIAFIVKQKGKLAKIVDVDKDDLVQPYYICLPLGFDNRQNRWWIRENDIERELNDEEIEQFKREEELNTSANKYNL